jgi:predicted chitinase
MNTHLSKLLPVLSLGLALTLADSARAQNPYVQPPIPYYPGYPGGFYPGRIGGAYYGAADLVRATGELQISQEQARIEREKANQAKFETQKKAFEQMMYEKANRPTMTEELEYGQNLTLQRMMTSPTPTEITSGKTLNAMLPMIKTLAIKGTSGPPIPLNQEQLRRVNVTVGKDQSSVGMVRDGGVKLDWPLCLQSPKQQQVAAKIPVLVSQAKMGGIDAKLYRDVTKELDELNDDLRAQFRKEEILGQEYLEGKRFLENLTPTINALRQQTSQRFLDGTYAAQGATVPELVANMTKSGLSFAPCNLGDEAVYYALNDMFVAYTTSAQAAAGFQVKYNPPRTDPWKVK